jgi:endonuclease/exonuclease/phosphatase family metal-dependent hydrolase
MMVAVLIRGMTYNLKFPSEDSPHAWSARRPLLAEVLRQTAPQVIGTQEGHYFQLREIVADAAIPYEWIGLGRGGGSHDEFNAILFDPRILEPVEFDHFWLSKTPELIGSRARSWHNTSIRMATWVRFRYDGGELLWLNTHLDNAYEEARVGGATLITSRLADFPADLPVVVSGDFNCASGSSAAYDILTRGAGLVDSWKLGNGPNISSYGGWKQPGPGERIDWLLVRGMGAENAAICDYHVGEEWPSDHVPVYVDLKLG